MTMTMYLAQGATEPSIGRGLLWLGGFIALVVVGSWLRGKARSRR